METQVDSSMSQSTDMNESLFTFIPRQMSSTSSDNSSNLGFVFFLVLIHLAVNFNELYFFKL